KESLTKKDKLKIEEIKRIIAIYKLWSDYSKDLTALKESNYHQRKKIFRTFVQYPRKYYELTKERFPNPYQQTLHIAQEKQHKKQIEENENRGS
ncbi:MAG: hypothetical protein OIF32_00200, partial [Campylobacterales bacterium]|nr:hypothetical protein [Campylobacterales bacterium]